MNICMICHGYPPSSNVGGIEVFTQTLARGMVARGHQILIISFSNGYEQEKEEDDLGVSVLRLPPMPRGILPMALRRRLYLERILRREINKRQINLVECPDVKGSILIGHLGIPLVVRMHGAINLVHRPETGRKINYIVRAFEKRTLKLADFLIACSEYVKQATLSAAGLEKKSCEVIYNGVDTRVFRTDETIERDSRRILFVGRLSETKGAPNLFRALPEVFECFSDVYLRFVGQDPCDNEGKCMSEKLIWQLPEIMQARVEVVGEMDHSLIPREFQEAGIAVFPSRAEAHPIAVLEAMACGTPVVFMNHGPGPEMIKDGEDGILCDTSSPESIAKAIITILSNRERALHMGIRAAKRIESNLSLNNTIKHSEALYRQIIEDFGN